MLERPARLIAIALVFGWIGSAAAAAPAPFAHWVAVVVAGDHVDADGNSTEGFDSARRAISDNLLALGFVPGHLAEFSARPREYRSLGLQTARPLAIERALARLVRKTSGGCVLYFTSHGAEDGLVVSDWIMPPLALARMVDRTCGARPTVVIVSACFSGLMLPPLRGPDRMILTAARRDRTSFGCGQSDRYPYFDQCVLEVWKHASGFPDLARRARACVAAREKAEHLRPASDPQFWIGPVALASLPRWH